MLSPLSLTPDDRSRLGGDLVERGFWKQVPETKEFEVNMDDMMKLDTGTGQDLIKKLNELLETKDTKIALLQSTVTELEDTLKKFKESVKEIQTS